MSSQENYTPEKFTYFLEQAIGNPGEYINAGQFASTRIYHDEIIEHNMEKVARHYLQTDPTYQAFKFRAGFIPTNNPHIKTIWIIAEEKANSAQP